MVRPTGPTAFRTTTASGAPTKVKDLKPIAGFARAMAGECKETVGPPAFALSCKALTIGSTLFSCLFPFVPGSIS